MSLGLALTGCTTPGPVGSTGTESPTSSDASDATHTSAGPGETSTPTSDATTAGSDAATTTGGAQGRTVLYRGTLAGAGRLDLEFNAGVITAAGVFEPDALEGATVIDVDGRFLTPAFIDSHVHLAYLPVASALAERGIAAAVDLAAPIEFLDDLPTRPRVIASGPMVTAVGGYPTLGWGANGYGLECADEAAALAAVDLLHERGAGVIKIPITNPPVLELDIITAAVARAHEHGLKVATHALDDGQVAQAIKAGIDVLAHTPTYALSDANVSAWSGRAVVTTLAAFGAGPDTIANLAKLRAAGATALYGTDLGNTQDAGVQASELAAMMNAGMDGAAIVAAGTSAPAAYWGLASLGALEVDKAASVLVLAADPTIEPMTLSAPEMVFLDGERVDD